MTPTIEEIHESLVNGQRKQMVSQIDEYGVYDFWSNYRDFLRDSVLSTDYFIEVTVSYFRIKNR